MRVHEDELEIDEPLVRALLAEQFPQWAELPLDRAGDGTVNVIYRLGEELSVRLPRREGPWADVERERRVLQRVAPWLSMDIPRPVGMGVPGRGYPWPWSVVTWIDGGLPTGPLAAADVASFVLSLRAVDPSDGPEPAGDRGRPLAGRDEAVRDALERVEAPGALELWERAAAAPEWAGERVWLHADLDARNVLVRDGRLAGVIDWGGAGVGDPAVDVMAAWKLVSRDERDLFRALVAADDATWLRAQGWALSQALIALGYYTPESNPPIHAEATRWLVELLRS